MNIIKNKKRLFLTIILSSLFCSFVGLTITKNSYDSYKVNASSSSAFDIYFENHVINNKVDTYFKAPSIHYWGTKDKYIDMTYVFDNSSGKGVYKCNIPSGISGYQICGHCNNDDRWVVSTNIDVFVPNTTFFYNGWTDDSGVWKIVLDNYAGEELRGDWDSWTAHSTQMVALDSNHYAKEVEVDYKAAGYEFKMFQNFTLKYGTSSYTFSPSISGPAYLKYADGSNMKVTFLDTWVDRKIKLNFEYYYDYGEANNRLTVSQTAQSAITFDSAGGSAVPSIYKYDGEQISSLPTPIKLGYSFNGWYDGDTKITTPYVVNGDKELLAHWTENTYYVKVNDTTSTTLTKSDTPTEGYILQYEGTIDVSHLDKLYFYEGTNKLVCSPTSGIYNNNVNSNGDVILSATNVKVYLKFKSSGDCDYYLEGHFPSFKNGERYLVINYNSTSLVKLSANPHNQDEYMITGLQLNQNDTVSLLYIHGTDAEPHYDYYCIPFKSGGLSTNFSADANNLITCNVTRYYDVYPEIKASGSQIYFGASSAQVVRTYAEDYNTEIAKVCDAHGHTNLTNLTTTWNNLASEYNKLDSYAKQYAKDAFVTATGDSAIDAFAANYAYVLNKYYPTLSDFIGIKSLSNMYLMGFYGSNNSVNVTTYENDSNSATIFIVILSSVSLLAVAGASFFIYKKKKHN